jgi:hypothetical protein
VIASIPPDYRYSEKQIACSKVQGLLPYFFGVAGGKAVRSFGLGPAVLPSNCGSSQSSPSRLSLSLSSANNLGSAANYI